MFTRLTAFLFLVPALIFAATIEGNVKDPSGAAVPGAAVTVKSAAAPAQTSSGDPISGAVIDAETSMQTMVRLPVGTTVSNDA